MKTVYVFQCSDKKTIYAFSSDNSSVNIPHEHCSEKWNRVKEIVISEETSTVLGLSSKQILDALSKDKYFITEIDPGTLEKVMPR
jgi:hypothetical protein